MQARQTLPHPQAEVGGGRGEEQVDGITCDAAQIIATEPKVAFEMADARFDGGAATEALPSSALLIGRRIRRRSLRSDQQSCAIIAAAAITAIRDRDARTMSGQSFYLLERWRQRVAVVGVVFQT